MAKKPTTQVLATNQLNPQYLKLLSFYTNPASETFNNITASGVKAGFTRSYSQNILNKKPKWFTAWMIEFGGDLTRLNRAEQVLDRVLKEDYIETAIGAFGVIIDKKTGEPMKRVNTQIMKVNLDAAKFIGETIGRNKYSRKLELVPGFSGSDVKEYD